MVSRRRRNPWLMLAMFCAAAALFLAGYYWGNQYKRSDLTGVSGAILLRPAPELPDFRATDQSGRGLGRDRLAGKWTLLLMGTLGQTSTQEGLTLLTRVYNRMAEYGKLQEIIGLVFISPDSQHDSRAMLGGLVVTRNPAMTAAHGSPDSLAGLTAFLGVGADTDTPLPMLLVDPRLRVAALFTLDQDPATIARDIHIITREIGL